MPERRPPFRCLVFLGILLATTHPLPAPVTVLPEATPKPKPTVKPKEPKSGRATSSGASRFVGVWRGLTTGSSTSSRDGQSYSSTESQPVTITVGAGGTSVLFVGGGITTKWIKPPPGTSAAPRTIAGGPSGPYSPHLNGDRLEWTQSDSIGTIHRTFNYVLTPGADGQSLSFVLTMSSRSQAYGATMSGSRRGKLTRIE